MSIVVTNIFKILTINKLYCSFRVETYEINKYISLQIKENLMDILVMLLVFILIIVLFIWFTAEYLLGFYMYPALLDVYGLLSFEFQTIDEVERKVKKCDSVHIKKLLNCIPLKIINFKMGVKNKEEIFSNILRRIIQALQKLKLAETMSIRFQDDETFLHHPIIIGLTEQEIHRYRQQDLRYEKLTQLVEKLKTDEGTETLNLLLALTELEEMMKESFEIEVLCVKKLPNGRPNKKNFRKTFSYSEIPV